MHHLVLDLKVNVDKHLDVPGGPLLCALQHQHQEIAIFLMKEGKALVQDGHLQEAICRDMEAVVEEMIVQGQVHADSVVDGGDTIFCRAALYGSTKVMQVFIQHFGSDVIIKPCPKDSFPPLFSAVTGKELEMVEWLINEAGADPMSRDEEGRTALHAAAAVGNPQMCHLLLSRWHVPADERGPGMRTPLHNICAKMLTIYDEEIKIPVEDRLAVVRIFIEAGADRNAQDDKGLTPLDLARRNGFDQILDYLTREDREAAVSK